MISGAIILALFFIGASINFDISYRLKESNKFIRYILNFIFWIIWVGIMFLSAFLIAFVNTN